MLKMLGEEEIREDNLEGYFADLYRVVCVGERPGSSHGGGGALMRTTYIAEWEELVHLLEDYTVFHEDIVELTRIAPQEAAILRVAAPGVQVARA